MRKVLGIARDKGLNESTVRTIIKLKDQLKTQATTVSSLGLDHLITVRQIMSRAMLRMEKMDKQSWSRKQFMSSRTFGMLPCKNGRISIKTKKDFLLKRTYLVPDGTIKIIFSLNC